METPIVRKVGVEIECIIPELSRSKRIDIEQYAVIDYDGSIDISSEDENEGKQAHEIKTRPATGEAAESAITKICSLISDAHVNTSCGLHVHADAAPLALNSLVKLYHGRGMTNGQTLYYIHVNYIAEVGFDENLMAMRVLDVIQEGGSVSKCIGKFGEGVMIELRGVTRRNPVSPTDGSIVIAPNRYDEFLVFAVNSAALSKVRTRLFNAMRFFAVADPIIRSMVPQSRRRNSYCRPFEKMVRSGGKMPDSISEIYEGIVDRYSGINLRALISHGTIECRYHNGTVDAVKIIHWARMWARVVEVALSDRIEMETDALADVVSQKSRIDMFLALLDLPAATEKHLRARIRAFSGADSTKVREYIENKKAAASKTPVCVG